MSPGGPISDLLLRSQTDERLCALARDGHQRAFTVFVDRHAGLVAAIAAAIGGRPASEDVVQESLTRAWRALASGAAVTSPRAWLVAIVRHTALEMQRSAPPPSPEPSAEFADPRWSEASLDQRLEVRDLLRAVSVLPENQRRALLGAEFDGISRSELATELGVSEGAVRQLTHRARRSLRTAVTALVPYPVAAWAAAGGGLGATAVGGLAAKGGAALLAAGAIGGGVVLGVEHAHATHIAPTGLAHRAAAHHSANAATAALAGTSTAVAAALAADRATRAGTHLSRHGQHQGAAAPLRHYPDSEAASNAADEVAAESRDGAAGTTAAETASSTESDGSDTGNSTSAPASSHPSTAAVDESDASSPQPATTSAAPAPATTDPSSTGASNTESTSPNTETTSGGSGADTSAAGGAGG